MEQHVEEAIREGEAKTAGDLMELCPTQLLWQVPVQLLLYLSISPHPFGVGSGRRSVWRVFDWRKETSALRTGWIAVV